MKQTSIFFVLILIVLADFGQTNDTVFVLLKVRGRELIDSNWNKNQFFEKQVISSIKKNNRKNPVRIISVEDSSIAAVHSYHFLLELNILELRLNDPIITQQNKSLSREVNTNNYSDEAEDLRKTHSTVTADFTSYEQNVNAFVRIEAATIKLPEFVTTWNDLLVESYNWENKYATYTGNFLALGNKEIELARSKPRPIPKPEQIFKDMVRQGITKTSKKISDSFQ